MANSNIDLTYADFKYIVQNKGLKWQYKENGRSYRLFSLDFSISYAAEILKSTWLAQNTVSGLDVSQENANETDFVDNFKPTANEIITSVLDDVEDPTIQRLAVDTDIKSSLSFSGELGAYSNKLKLTSNNTEQNFNESGLQVYYRIGSGMIHKIHFEVDTSEFRPELILDGVNIFDANINGKLLHDLKLEHGGHDQGGFTFIAEHSGSDHYSIDFDNRGIFYSASVEFKLFRQPNIGYKKLKRYILWETRLT